MDRHVVIYEATPDLSGVLMVARRFIAGEGERLRNSAATELTLKLALITTLILYVIGLPTVGDEVLVASKAFNFIVIKLPCSAQCLYSPPGIPAML